MIKRAIIGLAMFTAGIGAAEAATVSQVFELGGGGNAFGIDLDPIDAGAIAFEGFDATLGELQNVSVTLDLDVTSFQGFENTGSEPEEISLTQQFAVAVNGELFFLQFTAFTFELAANDFELFSTGPVSVEADQTFGPGTGPFSAFAEGGTLDLAAALIGAPTSNSTIDGTVRIDFDFIEAPEIAPVPLPASALLMFAGLSALAVLRTRRRRRA